MIKVSLSNAFVVKLVSSRLQTNRWLHNLERKHSCLSNLSTYLISASEDVQKSFNFLVSIIEEPLVEKVYDNRDFLVLALYKNIDQ